MADPEKQMVVEDGSDHEDLSSDDEAAGAGGQVNASSLLQDPAVMAALQGKLGAMVGTPSGYVASLPAPVRRRIKALKKLQLEATKIEAKFYEEVREANFLEWDKIKFVMFRCTSWSASTTSCTHRSTQSGRRSQQGITSQQMLRRNGRVTVKMKMRDFQRRWYILSVYP